MESIGRSKLFKAIGLTIASLVIFAGVAVVSKPAKAQTIEELQAQIQQLLEQIAQLQAQLAALQGEAQAPAGEASLYCYNFTRNLTVGMRGDDVKALQEILIAEGTWTRPDIGATGYFGPITKASLAAFQEKYADEILTPLGLTKGTGYFGPSTRSFLEKQCQLAQAAEEEEEEEVEEEVEEEEGAEEEEEVVEEGITVSLAEDTPASANVPNNASNVPFLKVKFTGKGTIDEIVITRVGAGTTDDFDYIYLYEGDTKLTTGRSLNSSTHQARFTNLNLEIDGEKVITVVADLSGSGAGNVNALELTS
ncbi:peptidoglycan-binding protein, partial [bacterium]|nr:peptidoglycan-binding protein [bacterium]